MFYHFASTAHDCSATCWYGNLMLCGFVGFQRDYLHDLFFFVVAILFAMCTRGFPHNFFIDGLSAILSDLSLHQTCPLKSFFLFSFAIHFHWTITAWESSTCIWHSRFVSVLLPDFLSLQYSELDNDPSSFREVSCQFLYFAQSRLLDDAGN